MRAGAEPLGRRLTAESLEGEARKEPGARLTEVEPGEVETQAEPCRQRPRVAQIDWNAKAEPQAGRTKVENGDLADLGRPGGSENNSGAGRVEGRGAARGPEICGATTVMNDQGRARGMMEPGRA
ncbi:hypothetical protein DPX16_21340 [Anabarilius grahami]|uniref:Uncharacterized protein n=1 Tax=Anabarilius grahami TaxID=495550 RepID=A0A3N0XER5_ANAGA|nr:hypothetical protein DPX16_21340 [Anabarilius grahami]